MMSSFASNAILAKSAAMYGRMLTGQDYTDLLNCRSVSEVAAYLKTRTSYADIFEGVSTITIHRGRLEELLKKRLFMQYASLCRYEMSIGQDFYKYFIIKNDILQILSCVRLLGADRPGDYLFTLPAFFNEHTGLDLIKMATAKSFEDLLDVLEGTPYQKVLAPFRGVSLTSRSNLDIEAALYKYFYYELWALANKAFRGKRLEGVLDVLRIQADMRTLVSLYRLKNMLDAHEVLLRQFTFPGIGNLTDKQLTALVRAPSAKEMLKSLEMTRYRNQLDESDYGYVEAATHRILYRWSKKYFRFSTDPTVVMFCYIYLAENEIENITHIVEGIRYDVPPENIKATLIGADSHKSS